MYYITEMLNAILKKTNIYAAFALHRVLYTALVVNKKLSSGHNKIRLLLFPWFLAERFANANKVFGLVQCGGLICFFRWLYSVAPQKHLQLRVECSYAIRMQYTIFFAYISTFETDTKKKINCGIMLKPTHNTLRSVNRTS